MPHESSPFANPYNFSTHNPEAPADPYGFETAQDPGELMRLRDQLIRQSVERYDVSCDQLVTEHGRAIQIATDAELPVRLNETQRKVGTVTDEISNSLGALMSAASREAESRMDPQLKAKYRLYLDASRFMGPDFHDAKQLLSTVTDPNDLALFKMVYDGKIISDIRDRQFLGADNPNMKNTVFASNKSAEQAIRTMYDTVVYKDVLQKAPLMGSTSPMMQRYMDAASANKPRIAMAAGLDAQKFRDLQKYKQNMSFMPGQIKDHVSRIEPAATRDRFMKAVNLKFVQPEQPPTRPNTHRAPKPEAGPFDTPDLNDLFRGVFSAAFGQAGGTYRAQEQRTYDRRTTGNTQSPRTETPPRREPPRTETPPRTKPTQKEQPKAPDYERIQKIRSVRNLAGNAKGFGWVKTESTAAIAEAMDAVAAARADLAAQGKKPTDRNVLLHLRTAADASESDLRANPEAAARARKTHQIVEAVKLAGGESSQLPF